MKYNKSIFVRKLVNKLKMLHLPIENATDTLALNKEIASLAQEFDISSWALGLKQYDDSGRDKAHISGHEWLYDMVCYKYENEHYALNDTILVMESEWKGKRTASDGHDDNDPYGEVKFDFQKLLLSNADIKLMVYRKHGDKSRTDIDLEHYFQRRIDNYRQGATTALFIFARYSGKENGKRTCTVSSYTRNGEWKQL